MAGREAPSSRVTVPQGAPRLPTADRAHSITRDFYEAARHRFYQAEAVVGRIDTHVSVGGLVLACRYAGPALEPVIGRALRHNLVPPVERADCTVYVWDSASTGVDMIPPCWSVDDYHTRGEVRFFADGVIFAGINPEGVILSMFDAATSTAMLWARDWRAIPHHVRADPLLFILHWWLRRHGRHIIHGGAVGSTRGAVLLAGRGGSGKSNTALGSLTAGLHYLSDDYCAVGLEPEPRVYSVFGTGKTHAADLSRLPHLAAHVSNRDSLPQEKALYFIHEAFADRILRQAPIAAIVLPHLLPGGLTRLRPASPAAALMALAPSTIFQLAHAGADVTTTLGALVRRVPCLHLDIRPGDDHAPALLASWLADAQVRP